MIDGLARCDVETAETIPEATVAWTFLGLDRAQMLAAGVRFFDRTSPEEEVRIAAPLNGTVKMAPLEILESDASVAAERKTPAAQRN